MYRLWLIQRGTFKNVLKEEITGIDSLFKFHYMGSAEFEFGALPQSLRRIIEANYGLYDFVEVESVKDKEGNTARVYCKMEEVNDAIEAVKHLSKNDNGYKEFAGMNKYIKEGIGDSYYVGNFWWDVENDFFVIFGDDKQELLQAAISKMEEKWDVKPKPKKKGLFKK